MNTYDEALTLTVEALLDRPNLQHPDDARPIITELLQHPQNNFLTPIATHIMTEPDWRDWFSTENFIEYMALRAWIGRLLDAIPRDKAPSDPCVEYMIGVATIYVHDMRDWKKSQDAVINETVVVCDAVEAEIVPPAP